MVPRRRFHRYGKSFSLSVGSRRHDRDPGEADHGSAQSDGASWFMGVRDETVCSAVGGRTYIPSRRCRPCSAPCGRSSGRREATTRSADSAARRRRWALATTGVSTQGLETPAEIARNTNTGAWINTRPRDRPQCVWPRRDATLATRSALYATAGQNERGNFLL